MLKQRVMGIVFAGLTAVVAATAMPGEAEACGGEWFPEIEVDYRPMGVAMAEKQLEAGKLDEAAATIIRVMPHIAQLDPAKSKIVERAQRVLSIATARTSGTLDIRREVPDYALSHWSGKDAKERETNLTFAVNALRKINEIKANDPAAQTELAEALAKVDGGRTEAREILEKLAKSDLIATPEGYAALAELRAEAGDESGKTAAITRCEAMASDAAMCKLAQS